MGADSYAQMKCIDADILIRRLEAVEEECERLRARALTSSLQSSISDRQPRSGLLTFERMCVVPLLAFGVIISRSLGYEIPLGGFVTAIAVLTGTAYLLGSYAVVSPPVYVLANGVALTFLLDSWFGTAGSRAGFLLTLWASIYAFIADSWDSARRRSVVVACVPSSTTSSAVSASAAATASIRRKLSITDGGDSLRAASSVSWSS